MEEQNTYNINIEKAIIEAAHKFDEVMERLVARKNRELPSLPEGSNSLEK